MIDFVTGIILESYTLLAEMSVYLLFGFLVAGVLHVFLRPQTIARHLGENNYVAVIKAAFLGIPLPLCSCGVIPAALSLRKEGASKGAVLSFLISTPTTGVDSIFATYAFLGWMFTIYRVIASFIASLVVGFLANVFIQGDQKTGVSRKSGNCNLCNEKNDDNHKHSFFEGIQGVFKYAFFTLLNDVGDWLVLGILIGGVISYCIPSDLMHAYVGNGFLATVVMLFIGMPMYVCASGSIPIAVALIMKGLNPGAAFAFLMAGPSTNTVTMSFVYKNLGAKALSLYLFSIIVSSLTLGLLLDFIWRVFNISDLKTIAMSHSFFTDQMKLWSVVILILLIIFNKLKGTLSYFKK